MCPPSHSLDAIFPHTALSQNSLCLSDVPSSISCLSYRPISFDWQVWHPYSRKRFLYQQVLFFLASFWLPALSFLETSYSLTSFRFTLGSWGWDRDGSAVKRTYSPSGRGFESQHSHSGSQPFSFRESVLSSGLCQHCRYMVQRQAYRHKHRYA